jgi:cobalamin synthase
VAKITLGWDYLAKRVATFLSKEKECSILKDPVGQFAMANMIAYFFFQLYAFGQFSTLSRYKFYKERPRD